MARPIIIKDLAQLKGALSLRKAADSLSKLGGYSEGPKPLPVIGGNHYSAIWINEVESIDWDAFKELSRHQACAFISSTFKP